MLCACLVLCGCLAVRADCGGNCAFCSRQLNINSIECVSECAERRDSGNSWRLCKHLMLRDDNTPGSAENEQQHHVDRRYEGFMKRYGGFMKRYGGFMKKTAEIYGMEPEQAILSNDEAEATDEEGREKRYGGFMKRGGGGRELHKRYGGFMRRVGEPQWSKRFLKHSREEEDGDLSGIEKRYGGFMGI
ncbi:proenkephalin b [Siphateles boraxobius]|uniref:proenkephalin b n=1 Tax=Siphateles boraxobius TaxID=180520 RepID=UPI004063074F